ncbi:MAG: ThiF family adenylyltransferase [Promethearchaeota archaeon]
MDIFENKKYEKWSESYWRQISRNIGLIKASEQDLLKETPITIFGTGGMGGPLAEQLVRAGCEKIIICDNDRYEETNLNRQLCTREDLRKYKVDVIENFLIKINSNIDIKKFYDISEENISGLLKDAKIAALLLDDPIASILISRECLIKKIPLIESWAIPYLCAWWFTEKSVDYEKCYGFDTHNMSIKQIKDNRNILSNLKKKMFYRLLKFPKIRERYDREQGAVNGMLSGQLTGRSFAPIVRLMSSYVAIEVIFTGILKLKKMILAPNIIGYDYFQMKPFEISFLD